MGFLTCEKNVVPNIFFSHLWKYIRRDSELVVVLSSTLKINVSIAQACKATCAIVVEKKRIFG